MMKVIDERCSHCGTILPAKAHVCPLCGTMRPDAAWSDERTASDAAATPPWWLRAAKCLALTTIAYIGGTIRAYVLLLFAFFGGTGPAVSALFLIFWLLAMAIATWVSVNIWRREFGRNP